MRNKQIEKISIEKLMELNDKEHEYLVIQACRDDLNHYKFAIKDLLIMNEIVPKEFEFNEFYSFENKGFTNMVFALNDKDVDINRLNRFNSKWKDSYGTVLLKEYIEQNVSYEKKTFDVSEDDFKSYLELQKLGLFNMLNYDAVCGITGLDKKTHSDIINNYDELKEIYYESYKEIFNDNIKI